MKATYYVPGAEPKTYDCQPGEAPGTVNLLKDNGKIIVLNLPLIAADADRWPMRGYAVLVEEDGEKPPRSRKKEAQASSSKSKVAVSAMYCGDDLKPETSNPEL